ncbi:MAG: NfeD family protein [Verrucomicrobiota bacterium]
MSEWFNNLNFALQIFYGIGFVALALAILQAVLAGLGVGLEGLFDAFHLDFGLGDGSGASLLSGHTLSGFFLGLGFGGALAIENGASVGLATLIGSGAGLVLVGIIVALLTGLMKLQSDGSLNYENALNEEGTVYVTLPGNNEDGGGQIQIMIQGRLVTASARKSTPGSLAPGQRVKVTAMAGLTSFIVEPLAQEEPSK